MRLLASLVVAGFGTAVLPASAVPPLPPGAVTRIQVVTVEGLQPRTVGLAQRRRGLLSSPAAAVRELLLEVIVGRGADQPGIHPLVTPEGP